MTGPRDWGLGFLFDKEDDTENGYDWVGFENQGSSCIICSCPKAKLTLAITLNKLTLSRKVIQILTKIVCTSKGLRCPRFIFSHDDL